MQKLNFLTKIFSKIPEMESTRLIFRAIKKTDLQDIFEYSSNPKTSEFLLWSPHENLEYTKKFIDIVLSKYKSGDYNDWAIILKENNKMIGTCGFTRIDEYNSVAEIGYVINPKFWGHGYATEASKTVLKFAFEVLRVNRVEAKFIFGNEASLKVMNKIGMKFEGYQREAMYVKGRYRTIGTSSILKREYLLLDKYN